MLVNNDTVLFFLYFQDGNKHWVFWFIAEHLQPQWQPICELFFVCYNRSPRLHSLYVAAKNMSQKSAPFIVPYHWRRSSSAHPVHP